MKNRFKYILFFFALVLSYQSNAQERTYTDEEIGFDEARIIKELEKRNIDKDFYSDIIAQERYFMKDTYIELKNLEYLYFESYNSNKASTKSLASSCIYNLPQSEKNALQDFFTNLGGLNWAEDTNWLDYSSCNWYGITITDGHVTEINLPSNSLLGSIPSSISDFVNLEVLNIGNINSPNANSFPYPFQSEIYNLQNLKVLDINYADVTGTITFNFSPSIEYIKLSGNELYGNLDNIYVLTNLEFFYIGVNNLSGQLSTSFNNLINLKLFDIQHNHLNGEIVNRFNSSSQLRFLNLSSNSFSGSFPHEVSSLYYLHHLSLSFNFLNGELLNSFGNFNSLTHLSMGYNKLQGSIPITLADIETLVVALFPRNRFNYTFPDLTNTSALIALNYSQNYFRFIDFEDEFDSYVINLPGYYYSPQAKIDEEETINVIEGTSVDLIAFTDDYYSDNNTYRWYKGNSLISGATNRIYNIPSVNQSHAGDYYCLVNNTIVNGLTLERNRIYLNIDPIDCTETEITSISPLTENCELFYTEPILQCNSLYCFVPDVDLRNTNLDYTIYESNGTTVVYQELITDNNYISYTFTLDGDYILNISGEANGCSYDYTQTFTVECNPCENHIALVVDESGSISTEEAQQLRKGLKLFVESQKDKESFVSITGMSDQQSNIRTDHVPPANITSANINIYLNWILNYGNRNGTSGVSGSSDYWSSALGVVNGFPDPVNNYPEADMVIIFTDGAQTSNVNELKTQLQDIVTNSNLFVYGIDNEYYIHGDSSIQRLPQDQDPNFTSEDVLVANLDPFSRNVVPSLFLSLQYLLDIPEPIEHNILLNQAHFYGYQDFSMLGSGLTVLSNLLVNSGMLCGDPLEDCFDCFGFQPEVLKPYWLSAWVKEDHNTQVMAYLDGFVKLNFFNASETYISSKELIASGNIIDGWQRISGEFIMPEFTAFLEIELVNQNQSVPVFFDDVRIHPVNGNMKSFVYDAETYRLMSELDENNYSTFYEYDNEGGLIRVKKETSKGVKTIQETRSGNVINTTN